MESGVKAESLYVLGHHYSIMYLLSLHCSVPAEVAKPTFVSDLRGEVRGEVIFLGCATNSSLRKSVLWF